MAAQRLARMVRSLSQVGGAGLGLELRPQRIDHLVTRETLTRLQDEQKRSEQELLDAKTTPRRKATLRDQLSRSDRHMVDAREDLREAQWRLERLRSDLR